MRVELLADEFPALARGDWRRLTASEGKAAIFLRDSYFRRSWCDFDALFSSQACDIASNLGAILFKPESLVTHDGVRRILERVSKVAVLRHVVPITITRQTAHDLWRYQWDGATLDRIDLACEAVSVGKAAYTVWFADDLRIPLSVRFCRMKGPRQPTQRRAGDLRFELGSTDMMLTGLHVPDEPADLVRELGVLLSNPKREALLRQVACSEDSERSRLLLDSLLAGYECAALDVDRTLSGIRQRLAAQPDSAERTWGLLELELIMQGEKTSLKCADRVLRAAGLGISRWERILFLSQAIRHDFPERISTIADSGEAHWPR